MACNELTWFGLATTTASSADLVGAWAAGYDQSGPAVLAISDRTDMWRLRRWGRALSLADYQIVVAPAGAPARRLLALATGCPTRAVEEFQLTVRLLAGLEERDGTVYVVDYQPERVQALEQNIRATFPNCRVVGRAALATVPGASIDVAIRKSSPDLVLVGSAALAIWRWIVGGWDQRGVSSFVVAPRAVDRIVGTRRPARAAVAIVTAPFRLVRLPLLVMHRFRSRRARRAAEA